MRSEETAAGDRWRSIGLILPWNAIRMVKGRDARWTVKCWESEKSPLMTLRKRRRWWWVVVGGSECTSLSTSSFNRQHRVGGRNRISLGDLKVLCSFAGKCNNYETTAIVMAIWLSRGAAGIVAEEYVERAFKDEANEQLQRWSRKRGVGVRERIVLFE